MYWAAIIRIEVQCVQFIYIERKTNMSSRHTLKYESTKEEQKFILIKHLQSKTKTKKVLSSCLSRRLADGKSVFQADYFFILKQMFLDSEMISRNSSFSTLLSLSSRGTELNLRHCSTCSLSGRDIVGCGSFLSFDGNFPPGHYFLILIFAF